ncbi:methyltransferase domain-containing protein [Microbacterium sp. W4I20]|uniref:methyltransferase domain-containing protein n=1 Tax=Microbacterium sp. W4I20 TaxID=3042262 RepID=UPI0027864F49|nr:methyltransferase domain-containing protein [Microbacterium sp. W4I20]MDQ0726473.1 SAM-dependent methyltransferase [Microbacterium sp. W4I20]
MATMLRRYGVGARWYDLLSGERWVYRAGRQAGIALLGVRRGDVVLDLGCGTGLNFPALVEAVGPEGLVIGIDRSPDMLAMAQRRVDREGWGEHIRLLRVDAAHLRPEQVAAAIADVRGAGSTGADALLATYSLSVIGPRNEAWRRALATLRTGARACVVDMQPPHGFWRVLAPLARLACAAGGADISAHPWRLLDAAASPSTIQRTERKGGHIVAVAATLRK